MHKVQSCGQPSRDFGLQEKPYQHTPSTQDCLKTTWRQTSKEICTLHKSCSPSAIYLDHTFDIQAGVMSTGKEKSDMIAIANWRDEVKQLHSRGNVGDSEHRQGNGTVAQIDHEVRRAAVRGRRKGDGEGTNWGSKASVSSGHTTQTTGTVHRGLIAQGTNDLKYTGEDKKKRKIDMAHSNSSEDAKFCCYLRRKTHLARKANNHVARANLLQLMETTNDSSSNVGQ